MPRWLAILMLAGLAAAPAGAQETTADLPNAQAAQQAIAQIRSPYCPGLMLEVCPSPQAAALRDSIRVMASQGAEADELVEWVLSRHGEQWRGVPKRSGPGLWAWILPPLALLAGMALLVVRIRRAREERQRFPAPQVELSASDREQVAAALRRWEETEEVDQ